jgi:hypothetical protein
MQPPVAVMYMCFQKGINHSIVYIGVCSFDDFVSQSDITATSSCTNEISFRMRTLAEPALGSGKSGVSVLHGD